MTGLLFRAANRRNLRCETSDRSRRIVCIESLESRLPLTASIVGGGTYTTIQAAIDQARPNDEIQITAGIYPESVDLSRMGSARGVPQSGNLTMRGVGGEVTVNPASGQAMRNKTPFAGNLTIDNLGFTSPTSTGFSITAGYQGNLRIQSSRFNNNVTRRGIELSNTTGTITIVDSEIRNMGTKGIWMSSIENVLIDHLTIDDQAIGESGLEQDGIFGSNITNIQIRNSEIRFIGSLPADDGLDLTNVRGDVIIEDNWIHHIGDDGVQITTNDASIANMRISGNRISDNVGGGIEVRTQGLSTARTVATVTGNTISNLGDHGIEFSYKANSQLTAVIDGNDVTSINVESATMFETRDDAKVSVDFIRNQIHDTVGHGLRAIAENRSQMDFLVSESTFEKIGNEGNDAGVLFESDSVATASLKAVASRNVVRSTSGPGLMVRGLGATNFDFSAIGNTFDNTNALSPTAAVNVDKSVALDPTTIHLVIQGNTATNTHLAAAYRLNQVGSGTMEIVGTELTAQQVIENNNVGRPVTVIGAVGVVQLPNTLTVAASSTPDRLTRVGESVTLTGKLKSPANSQGLGIIVTWGDATNSSITSFIQGNDGSLSFTAPHQYKSGGIFPVTVTVVDDAGVLTTTATSAFVTGWRVADDSELQIVGTNERDIVEIKPGSTAGMLQLKTYLAGISTTNFVTQVGRMVVHLGPGDDEAKIDDHVTVNAEIHGRGGRDRLTSGGGHDLLLGGDGNDQLDSGLGDDILAGNDGDDRLEGGYGRDVQVGGRGFDQIAAADSFYNDILIGGRTLHDDNPAALRSVLAKWKSGLAMDVIIQDLTNAGGILEVGKQVFDDHARDEISASDFARDLVFADQDRKNSDDDSVRFDKWDTIVELGELLGV